jgi:transglutaminase-like putative cysteine protease
MSWRIEIIHRSTYRYESEVSSSYNEARMTPVDTDRQRVLSTRFDVVPSCSAMHYTDYWGTSVAAFDISTRHSEMQITSRSLVETSEPRPFSNETTWVDLEGATTPDRYGEYLTQTPMTASDDRVVAAAARLAVGLTPREAADAAVQWVRTQLDYRPGVTQVSTTATEALGAGVGVCQDFVHLTLSVLRAMGIPARYVSGYLHPDATAPTGSVASGQSHAWVEAWTGDWLAHDPTNGSAVGPQHVVVGRGRDYRDVAPLTGVYQGGRGTDPIVEVELRRLG